ncbi:MAG TPA: hypothetical protein ENH95_02885 [Nitrosopumilus sp.]|nr:hypothetical protein [Nitrosopumilus sp.]
MTPEENIEHDSTSRGKGEEHLEQMKLKKSIYCSGNFYGDECVELAVAFEAVRLAREQEEKRWETEIEDCDKRIRKEQELAMVAIKKEREKTLKEVFAELENNLIQEYDFTDSQGEMAKFAMDDFRIIKKRFLSETKLEDKVKGVIEIHQKDIEFTQNVEEKK